MELSVLERITIQGLLPVKGSYTNLKLLRVAKEALSFTDEEHKSLNFRQEQVNGQTRTAWNERHLVNKSTNQVLEGDNDYVAKMVNTNPDNYEMRPVLGDVDIKLGEVVTQMIVKALTNLDQADPPALEDQHFSLYEKFVLGSSRPELKSVK